MPTSIGKMASAGIHSLCHSIRSQISTRAHGHERGGRTPSTLTVSPQWLKACSTCAPNPRDRFPNQAGRHVVLMGTWTVSRHPETKSGARGVGGDYGDFDHVPTLLWALFRLDSFLSCCLPRRLSKCAWALMWGESQ